LIQCHELWKRVQGIGARGERQNIGSRDKVQGDRVKGQKRGSRGKVLRDKVQGARFKNA